MNQYKIVALIIAFVCCNRLLAQYSEIEITNNLNSLLREINYSSPDDTTVNKNNLYVNREIKNYLDKVLIDTLTLKMEFNGIPDFKVVRSDDDSIKIYQWGSGLGNNMDNTLIQLRTRGGIILKWRDYLADSVIGYYEHKSFDSIKNIHTVSGKTVYLFFTVNWIPNTHDVLTYAIESFTKIPDDISPDNFFLNGNRLSSRLEYSIYYDKQKAYIKLSRRKDKITIPLVRNNEVIGKNTLYKFNGEIFIKTP